MSNAFPTLEAGIVSDVSTHGGEPVIQGTETPVRAIPELRNQGMCAEEVPNAAEPQPTRCAHRARILQGKTLPASPPMTNDNA